MRQNLHWHQIVRRLTIGLLLLPLPASAFNDAQFKQATQLLDQLVAAARQGQTEQIDQIKQRIDSIPKPPRGDRKQARQYNDAGLERFRQSNYTKLI